MAYDPGKVLGKLKGRTSSAGLPIAGSYGHGTGEIKHRPKGDIKICLHIRQNCGCMFVFTSTHSFRFQDDI